MASSSSNISILTDLPTTPVRPPQPLDVRATIESAIPPLWSSDEEGPFPPLDWIIPALGVDFIARDEAANALDILAIARNARRMGRIADGGAIEVVPRVAAPTEPILTDLTVRDKAPTFDPILAGAVVVVVGTLTLRPDRSGGRRRLSIRPGR
jgi:hypothetical protein